MTYSLFLDDVRDPPHGSYIVARSFLEAVMEEYAFLGLNGSIPGIGYQPGLQDIAELYAPDNQTLITEKITDPGSMILLYLVLLGSFLMYKGMRRLSGRQTPRIK